MSKFKWLLPFLLATSSFAQLGYVPRPVAGFTYSGGSWIAAATSAVGSPLGYVPDPVALYCWNSGTGKWIPADSSCFVTPANVVAAINGQAITPSSVAASTSMSAPVLTVTGLAFPVVTATINGAAGSAMYTYVLVGYDAVGHTRLLGNIVRNGNATLSGSNSITITVPAWSATSPYIAPTGACNIFRTTGGGTTGIIGTIASCASGGSLTDTGLAGDGTTLPAENSGYINGQLSLPTSLPANSIVLLGDSITGYNFSAADAVYLYPDVGYWNQLNAQLRQRFLLLSNAGIGGNTLQQMLARVNSDVISQHPAYCLVEGGVNNIANGDSEATMWTNTKAIYTALQNAGIRVIATTVTPSSNNTAGAKVTAWSLLNSTIKEYVRSQPSIILLDFAQGYVDASTSTGQPLTNYTLDGIHPSALGATALANVSYPILNSIIPSIPVLPVSYAADPGNFVPSGNNFMVGTGGTLTGMTGTLAAGWSGTITGLTCVGSKGTRSDGIGGATQIVTISAGSGTTTNCTIQTGINSGWSVGQQIYMQNEIISANTSYSVSLQFYTSGWSLIGQLSGMEVSNTTVNTLSVSNLIVRSATIPIPAGTANMVLAISVQGTSGAVTFGRQEVRLAATF